MVFLGLSRRIVGLISSRGSTQLGGAIQRIKIGYYHSIWLVEVDYIQDYLTLTFNLALYIMILKEKKFTTFEKIDISNNYKMKIFLEKASSRLWCWSDIAKMRFEMEALKLIQQACARGSKGPISCEVIILDICCVRK